MSEETKNTETMNQETETPKEKTKFFTKMKGSIKNAKDKTVGYVKTHKMKIAAVGAGVGLAAYGAFKLLTNAKGENEYDPEEEFEPGDWLPEEEETEPEEEAPTEEVPEE